jgi:hypothetical protein
METQTRTERPHPITGKEGAEIEVSVAADWTKNHRNRHPGTTISEFFGAEIIQQILGQPDCMGIRIYYSNSKSLNGWQLFIVAVANFLIKVLANAEGEKHLILAGATKEGLDQIPGTDTGSTNEGEMKVMALKMSTASAKSDATILGEQSMPCPGAAGCPQNVLTGTSNK